MLIDDRNTKIVVLLEGGNIQDKYYIDSFGKHQRGSSVRDIQINPLIATTPIIVDWTGSTQ